MTQVYDLCAYVGELTRITTGSAGTTNEPPAKILEIKQIIEWVKHHKNDYESECQLRLQLVEEIDRLRSMPLREQLLSAVDKGIQKEMEELKLDVSIGTPLLKRIMDIVDHHMMVLLQEIDDLRDFQSQLVLDIDNLNVSKHRMEEEMLTSRQKISSSRSDIKGNRDIPASVGAVAEMSNNATFKAIEELKKDNEALHARVAELTKRASEDVGASKGNEPQSLHSAKHSRVVGREEELSQRVSVLEQENEDLRLRKDIVDQVHQSKNEIVLKLSEANQELQELRAELAGERQMGAQKETQMHQLRQATDSHKSPGSNKNAEELARQLMIANSKIQQMMTRVANYQNKVIDLELANQGIIFQLNTYKSRCREEAEGGRQEGSREQTYTQEVLRHEDLKYGGVRHGIQERVQEKRTSQRAQEKRQLQGLSNAVFPEKDTPLSEERHSRHRIFAGNSRVERSQVQDSKDPLVIY